jgi:flagellar motor switch protein FliM
MMQAARMLPISADLLRSKAKGSKEKLATLAPFSELLAERMAAVLCTLGDVAVKASVEQTAIEALAPIQQAESGFDLVSPQGTIAIWFQPDRTFDAVMCELCLGGSGGFKTAEDAERPPTLFERRLRNMVVEKLAGASAATLAEISEQPDVKSQTRARVAVRKIEAPLSCYALKVLINVFDEACELTLHFALADCLKLAGAAQPQQQAEAPAARDVLDTTPFSLEVYLKPDVVDVRHILTLAPGAVLRLNVAAAAPVELKFNGQKIGAGLMGHDGERVRVRLLDDGSQKQEPQTVANLLKLVNERAVRF